MNKWEIVTYKKFMGFFATGSKSDTTLENSWKISEWEKNYKKILIHELDWGVNLGFRSYILNLVCACMYEWIIKLNKWKFIENGRHFLVRARYECHSVEWINHFDFNLTPPTQFTSLFRIICIVRTFSSI